MPPAHLNFRAGKYPLQQMLHVESLTTLELLFFSVNLISKLNISSEHNCLTLSQFEQIMQKERKSEPESKDPTFLLKEKDSRGETICLAGPSTFGLLSI